MSKICVVFGAGEYYDGPHDRPEVPDGAFMVAADGGLDHTRALGVIPDVVVGDFDSLEGEPPAAGTRTIALPPLKDDPDMLSALKIGWQAGAREFHIWGGLGGRIDHTLANVQLLAAVSEIGGMAFLHGNGTIVTAITDGRLDFAAHEPAPAPMVSVFSHSDVSLGVNETGLKYELHDATLHSSKVVGLSNEFLPGVPASIEVCEGTLTVTFPAGTPLPRVERRHAFEGDLGPLDTEVSALLAVPPSL